MEVYMLLHNSCADTVFLYLSVFINMELLNIT